MKKLLIPILFLVSCTPPSTCPSGPCVEQPGVAPMFAPVLVPAYETPPCDDPTNPTGPYDTTLTWEDLELEGEFQDDTIGQPKY